MVVLVINCGSSSFKYQLLEMDTETLLCSGLVERIGEEKGNFIHKKYAGGEPLVFKTEERYADHSSALKAVLATLTDAGRGSVRSIEEIKAIGHRVVQGGEALQKACVVGAKEREIIRGLAALAPLHNPANLQGIDVALALCPHAPSVAVFDTEFHATMPPKAFRYAVPHKFYSDFGIRRYGFHGTSHRYVSRKAAQLLGRHIEEINLITCHLGNGCSMTAIKGGRSIDTSMGFTPLAGTIMGTRCGDIDPAVPLFLISKGFEPSEVDRILNKESGLKGIGGVSDLRDLHAARAQGDANAQLAFEMFCHSIRRQLGALWATLGKVDAVVFTAGIGENDPEVRQGSIAGLESWGLSLDPAKNAARSPEPRSVSPAGAKVPVLVIPTNEELEIARTVLEVLA